jgi:hypothetical protein
MSAVIVFGGYGVFGAQVARELVRAGNAVTVAGRNGRRAARLAATLGLTVRGLAVNVRDRGACRAALQGQAVAVNCAGSAADLGPGLLDACLDAGCHYVDIAFERASAAVVRGRADDFRRHGLAAVYGCSSLPALSGALAVLAGAGRPGPPERARVTLLIGNDNPKGRAAVQAFLDILGRPIAAPQGTLHGFRDREVVSLPPPFGQRAVFNFDGPEYDLFPALVGVKALTVKVGFELWPANYGFALLASCGVRLGPRAAAVISAAGEAMRWLGCSGGAVLAELFYADGSCRRASLAARSNGQRMAVLPCVLATEELCRDKPHPGGSLTAYELLAPARLLQAVADRGFELRCDSVRRRQEAVASDQ